MFEIVRLDSPEFVRFTFCAALVVPAAWLANVREVGVKVTAGAATVVPVPDRPIVRGLPGALSVILMLPVRTPAIDGLNVIRKRQKPFAAMAAPLQLLVCAKSVPP